MPPRQSAAAKRATTTSCFAAVPSASVSDQIKGYVKKQVVTEVTRQLKQISPNLLTLAEDIEDLKRRVGRIENSVNLVQNDRAQPDDSEPKG